MLCCLFQTAFAQQEMGLFLLEDAWQSNQLNPAFFPKSHKIVVGLPGLYSNSFISNVTYGDLEETDENGNTVLNANKGIAQLEEVNFLRENAHTQSFSLGLNLGAWKFSFGHALNFGAYIKYPKTLAQLIWEGNAQFIGQEIGFAPDFQVSAYHEWSLGTAYDITENITIGGRLKYLSGVGDASNEGDQLDLFTDEVAYDLTLNADYVINSTDFVAYNGLSDIALNSNFGNLSAEDLFSSNNGLAFDVGINAHFGKFQVAASLLDIGEITWEEGAQNYSLTGTRAFQGIDVLDDILDNNPDFPSIIDSLEQVYEPEETFNSYSTRLLNRGYAHLSYQLNDRWKVGTTFYTASLRGESFTAIGIGTTGQLYDWLTIGANYSYRHESYDNLGLNAHFTLGPLQVLAATDNIITAFNFKDANNANFRVGLNLLFGKIEPLGPDTEENFFE